MEEQHLCAPPLSPYRDEKPSQINQTALTVTGEPNDLGRIRTTNHHHGNFMRGTRSILLMCLLAFAMDAYLFLIDTEVQETSKASDRLVDKIVSQSTSVVAPVNSSSDEDNPKPSNNSPYSPHCSCWNSTASPSCCHRLILRQHKFGYMITQQLFKPFNPIIQRRNIHPKELLNDTDYRHVVITRNLYSSLVSGYLYHKSGHECWLSFGGYPLPKSMQKKIDWENFMTFSDPPYNPCNGRSICQYLLDEKKEMGMRVYMDVALTRWYFQIIPYWSRLQQLATGSDRIKFICYEDLTNTTLTQSIFEESMDFLFPGGHDYVMPLSLEELTYNQKQSGHSTTRNSKKRERILKLVARLDKTIFNGTFAAMDAILGCHSEMERLQSEFTQRYPSWRVCCPLTARFGGRSYRCTQALT